MAIRVYRVAVVGCPRAAISQETSEEVFQGVGKSCLCNRFVRPEAYSETEHSSIMDEERWIKNSVFNGDHFIYWGAANKHLHDGTKVRFQVVEHTEIYADPVSNGGKLVALPSSHDYLTRASSLHFQSRTPGKEAYRLKATDEATKCTRGPVRTRQLFPNEDFGGNGGKKSMGIYGYVCVFDPTLEETQMQKQLSYLSSLLPLLKKRKLVIACVKCDLVDEKKIHFGANLAASALKKAIPFVEVSARDSVNVDDAFYSLVSPPKKSKSSKSSGRRSSPYLSYHDVIESRKGDVNRAKDVYRKLLQRKVTDFSCQWSQIQPQLLLEPDYQAVVSLAAASEAPEELVKKMFQLRLIEIKLTEANRKFGSTVKKANKDRSSAQQIYLSEAMRSHPDLGTDSMYDYVYSPGHSIAGDTDTAETEEQLTEPSTPSSSYHPTPDLHGSIISDLCDNGALPSIANAVSPCPRSATIPDMLVTVPSYDTSTLPPQTSNDNLLSPKMSTSLPRQPFTLPNEKEPPPLPPRDMGTLKKNKMTTQSQPFLENVVKQPGTLKREAEARRLSNSMDCLLLPEDDTETSQSGSSFSKLEAEPYLRPSDVKKVMGVATQSATTTAAARNSSIFMSMRVSGRSRPQLPTFQDSTDGPDSMKRSKSFERGHKRSRSNPFTLDLLVDGTVLPPELPPRNKEHPAPPVPSRRSPQHRASRSPPPLPPPGSGATPSTITVEETVESSLEFGNKAAGGRQGGRISRARSPQAVVRDLKEHTFKEVVEDDNISTISGPFEEIDFDRSSMATEHSVGAGMDMVRDSSSHTLPSQNQDDDENDQYARIEDVTQQYIAMAPAPANVKGATLPAQRVSYLSGDDLEEEAESSGKRAKSMSQAGPLPPTTPKKDPGVISRTMRRFRKQKTEPVVRESTDSPSPPPSIHTLSSSISSSLLASPNRHSLPRPLPPSPTKGVKGQILRKHSNGSGSNIYETIDEDLLNRVKNGRPRRQGSTKYDTVKHDFASLPVDPAMWPKYLQVIQKFFSLPEVQAKWVETVREIMPDEDAEDIPPPYYNTAAESSEKEQEDGEGEKKNALSRIQSTDSHQDDDQIPIHVPTSVSPLLQSTPGLVKSSPLVTSPHSPFQTPRHHQIMLKAAGASGGGGGSPRLINSPIVKRQASRDDLIEMMNQQLRHDEDSSDSETDSDEEAGMDDEDEEERGVASSDSDSTDYDSDVEQPQLPLNELPVASRVGLGATPIDLDNRVLVTPHTDLDEVLGTHNSVSTDSDHIEADPVIKSPQSTSVEELDHTHEGVVEDHCVKPSQFLNRVHQKQQSISEIKTGAAGTRSLSDSGISNQNYEENNQSETEC